MINAHDFCQSKSGKILRIATTEDLQQDRLDEILAPGIDIETLHGEDVLLLANIKQKHSDLSFGENNDARLKGLIRYHQFQNLNQMSFFSEIVQIINKDHIVPLLHNNVAFKFYIPDCYRYLTNTGIIIDSDEQFYFLQKKFQKTGYKIINEKHFFIITENETSQKRVTVFDSFVMGGRNRKFISEVFAHAKEEKVYNSQCLIPTIENLFYMTVCEIWQKIRWDSAIPGLASDIWDLYNIKKQNDISCDRLKHLLVENHMIARYDVVGSFVNGIVKDLLPMGLFDEKTISSEKNKLIWHERAVGFYYKLRKLFFK